MHKTGIIIVMAYPETVVMVADEWYSPFLRFLHIGKKNYLRAGHAALVLIDRKTGNLEYHDFGRYITSIPNGRVRGAKYDTELNFPLKANIVNGKIKNLNKILSFLASNPKLTHGDGVLIASVCESVNYDLAKTHINKMQRMGGVRYAAFIKEASNCARFVADTLIASVVDPKMNKALRRSTFFTPSTVGTVTISASDNKVHEVNPDRVSLFTSTSAKLTRKYFLDRIPDFTPNFVGNLEPKAVGHTHENAQWLPGIACGAWFEITKTDFLKSNEFRFRRISPHGNVDIDAVFKSNDGFDLSLSFSIIHNSNCLFCTVKQSGKVKVLNFSRLY